MGDLNVQNAMDNCRMEEQPFPVYSREEILAQFSEILTAEYVPPHGLPYAPQTTAPQLASELGLDFDELRQRVQSESAIRLERDRPITLDEAAAALKLFGFSPLRTWQARVTGPGTLVALADFYGLDVDQTIRKVEAETGMLLDPYHPLRPEAVIAITRVMADRMDPVEAFKRALSRLVDDAESLRGSIRDIGQRNFNRRAEEAKAELTLKVAEVIAKYVGVPNPDPARAEEEMETVLQQYGMSLQDFHDHSNAPEQCGSVGSSSATA